MVEPENYKDKELIVRKKVAGLIEKVLNHFEKNIRHDTYKSVVYGESAPMDANESRFKNYYDAYMYLLHNAKSPLTQELLQKFFFIFKTELLDRPHLIKISETDINRGYFYLAVSSLFGPLGYLFLLGEF